MKIKLLQEAQDELTAAVAYYENVEAGLGLRFKEEARAAILLVHRQCLHFGRLLLTQPPSKGDIFIEFKRGPSQGVPT